MKKIIALTLCLMMCAGCALAGTMPVELEPLSQKYALAYYLPEGVKSVDFSDAYGMKTATFLMEDESMPNYIMVISYSEVLHEKSLSDLSDEEIASLVAFTAADAESHAYEVIEMEDGWPGVRIDYDEESASDWVDAFTVIDGYILQVHGWHSDFSELTEEESAFAFTLLDSVSITDAE